MQGLTLIIMSAMVLVVSAHREFIGNHIKYNEYLLTQKKIDRNADKSSGFSKVMQFTEPILLDDSYKITRVEVIDYQQKKTSAKSEIILGGPGYSFVTINFVSKPGHGIHFIVKVYGKRIA